MYLVGLTGGIASGKSTVAHRFVEHGMELIDADDIAREVVLPGAPAWKEILEHFGHEVIDEDGFVDRSALGRVVFADRDKRVLLNEITHPRVISRIADQLEILTAFDGVVVIDVPLLVEAGVQRGYEDVVVVASTPDTQLRRLVDLRGMDAAMAQARIDAQAPLERKLELASHVIWNEGSLEELRAETDRVAAALLAAAREKAERISGEVPDD